jgi:anti-sigma-K factor RskA
MTPNRPDDRERFDDLKEAYALKALPDEDRRWFEGYLKDHPEAVPEVEDLSAVANLLSLAPPEIEPPPSLRREIMLGIGGDPTPLRPPGPRGLPPWLRSIGTVAAAFAVIVGGLTAWNVSLQRQNQELSATNGELAAEVEGLRAYALRGTGAASGVTGEVVSIRGERAVIVVEGLAPAPEGKTYEAWVVEGGMPRPAGIFEPHNGSAAAPLQAPLEGVEVVAVTLEPENGSPMPTSDALLTAEIT